MSTGLINPSYANGFAPRDGPPANPNLWQGLVGLWAPSLGPTGLTLRDQSGFQNDGTLTLMGPATTWVASEKGWAIYHNNANNHHKTFISI